MFSRSSTFIFILFISCSWLSSGNSLNNKFEIKIKEINQQLTKSFPFKKTYDGVTAEFSEPAVDLNTLDKTLKLNVIITVTDGVQNLRAKGQLLGKVEFYDFEKTLRFRKPHLDKFIILEDTYADNKLVVKVIKQSIGHNLPDLTLYNIEDLDLDRQITKPKEIEISLNRLVLYW